MRVVIPCKENSGMNSQIHESFLEARWFLFADVDLEKKELRGFECLEFPMEIVDPGDLPMFIKEHDGELLMVLHMPEQLRDFFNHMRIKVLTGISGNVKEIIDAFLKGDISKIIEKTKNGSYP